MYKDYIEFLESADIPYIKDEPMSRHTSFRIGGPCKLFVSPESSEGFVDSYELAKQHGISVYVLGRGSNVLFEDCGFDGIVLSTEKLSSVTIDGNRLIAGSGASFTHIAAVARDAGLSGLEFAYGIPGSVGGAVYMNAGAYGGEVSDCLASSTAFVADDSRIICVEGKDHNFGYRTSIYKQKGNCVILSAEFELERGNVEDIRAKMEDLMGRRKSKQPLEYPSAGSVFKRPKGYFVGQMIEELGLKGHSVGGAQISEKHAGFIINKDKATCKDVKDLIAFVKEKVKESYGVDLECEVIFVK